MRVCFQRYFFDRWIIVWPAAEHPHPLAWSGSRWVPIGGPVQICNFDTLAAAKDYAEQHGFVWQ